MTVPNILTSIRIALIPVFWILATADSTAARWWALSIFIIAAITDFIDGHIARSTGQVTDFGKIMDPLADKLLVLAALLVLCTQGRFPAWAVMVVIARELAVTSLRVVAIDAGKVLAAGMSGKIKTAVQLICIALFLLHLGAVAMDTVLSWIIVAVTVYSGVDYFIKNRQILLLSIKKRG